MYTSKVVLVIANTITTNTGSPVIALFFSALGLEVPNTKYASLKLSTNMGWLRNPWGINSKSKS